MQAGILVVTAVYALANLAADLLYAFFNPRIRYGNAAGSLACPPACPSPGRRQRYSR